MKKSEKIVCIGSLLSALVTVAFSEFDIVISSVFYSPFQGFYMRSEPFNVFVNDNMSLIDAGVLMMFVGFWLGSKINKESFFAVKKESLLFLFSSFAVLMVLGKIIKELWKRPRPFNVNIFGGAEDFVSPLVITGGAVEKSFSFPSGHTLCAIWLLSVALLLPKAIRLEGIILVAGITFAVMFSRITGGYHFLSDTIFSCLIAVPVIVAMKNRICGED